MKEEQKNDDAQKAFCDKDMASSAATKADTEEEIQASEALIEETKESSASLAEEVPAARALLGCRVSYHEIDVLGIEKSPDGCRTVLARCPGTYGVDAFQIVPSKP